MRRVQKPREHGLEQIGPRKECIKRVPSWKEIFSVIKPRWSRMRLTILTTKSCERNENTGMCKTRA